MTPAIDVLHVVSPPAADLLVASIWQSLLLTGAVGLCLRVVPGVPAGVRSGIWTAVLVLIVLLPAISAGVPHTGVAAGRSMQLANDWSLALVCVWALLSLFRAVQLCLGMARLRTLARSAKPVEVDATIASLLECGSHRALLCTSELVDRPSLIGFSKPRILLPPDLLGNLSRPELHQIVLHEIEHLRRGDQWTNLLQQVSLVLLPWNPAVLWLNRRLCVERELACDDGVMRATKARKAYAACLVRLAENSMLRRGVSLAIGALGAFESGARDSELVKRVRRILTMPEPGRSPKSSRIAMGAVLAGALVFSVLLARSPRLIDFASAPVTVAAGSADMQAITPTITVSPTDGAKPTLVKAVISGPSAGGAMARAVILHKRAVRPRRTLHAYAPPAIRVPVWHNAAPASLGVMTLTSAQGSQRFYAAVRLQGGWLVFQL
jgi:beta-lactamase regulating signal transducer with metallopeptidase domain